MKKALSTLLLGLLLVSPLSAREEITLEKIMQHPRWIGAWPEEAVFEPSGKSIFYLGHADPRGYEVVQIDLQGKVLQTSDTDGLPAVGGLPNPNGLYAFQGDLFLSTENGTRRLTRTSAVESEPRWLASNRFAYERDDEFFVRDLKESAERQVVEILSKDAPAKDDDFYTRQQDRLFPLLKEREEAAEKREADRQVPRFYIGEERSVVTVQVAPDERKALLVHGAQVSRNRDSMPVYLNRDGSVTSETLRAKVGAEEPTDHQLAILDLANERLTALSLDSLPGYTQDTTIYAESFQWSQSGRLLTSLFSEDFEERWIVEVDFKTGRLKLVEHLHDDAWHTWDLNEFGWLPASDSVWYQSEKTGYAHLYLWDGTQSKALTSGDYEVTSVHPSPDGQWLYFRANMDDPSEYNVYRVNKTGKVSKVTQLGGQTSFDLSPDGRSLLLLHSKTDTPPELFLQPAKPESKAVPITRTTKKEFLDIEWTLPQFVDVPSSHHSRTIRSKLYLPPKGVTPTGSAVLFVHGAGYLQNSDYGWSYYFREFMFHTLLTRRGVTVLDMDYRASAGYGRDWRAAIYRQMGTPELEDLKDGVTYLAKEHGVDKTRVGVYGGSYGGFLTLMALFKEPQLFSCGAALRPVTDWAQYEHGYTARILNTPEEDPEAFNRSSPIEFAEGLSKPLLMCHGMLDDNVVAQDTVRLTQRLIQLKKENWETALYPVEPHSFIEPESWLDEYRRILKLFEQNLRPRKDQNVR